MTKRTADLMDVCPLCCDYVLASDADAASGGRGLLRFCHNSNCRGEACKACFQKSASTRILDARPPACPFCLVTLKFGAVEEIFAGTCALCLKPLTGERCI